MLKTHVYRVLKSSWGIHISITGEIKELESAPEKSLMKIGDKVYLQIENIGLVDHELVFVLKGLLLIYDKILENSKPKALCIRLVDITFPLLDFQAEGLVYAIIHWMKQELKLAVTLPSVIFDKTQNRYVFDLDF